MGQIKGNPSADRSVQNQAYSSLYTSGTNQTGADRRDGGTKPVMIDDQQTLNDVVDVTFATDVVLTSVSSSINSVIGDKLTTSTFTTFSSSLVHTTSSTWNPTITGDAALFSNTINRKTGFYQKVGNIVNFTLHAEFQNPTASLISAGTFQFDLPIAPNNNWSGSWGLVNGTSNIHSNNSGASSTMYVVNGTKRVYFDGNRGGSSNANIYVHIFGQYNINN